MQLKIELIKLENHKLYRNENSATSFFGKCFFKNIHPYFIKETVFIARVPAPIILHAKISDRW